MRGKVDRRNRTVKPDEQFGSTTVEKFIHYIMNGGKKEVARKIVYDSLESAAKQLKKEPLEVFNFVISSVAPSVEVRSRRIGGANYQIPMEVKEPRRTSLAMRWIIEAARSKSGRPMSERLAQEYQDIFAGTGSALKKRSDTHKMADANKAFAHFARIK